jgi:hypothetical protein
LIDFEVRGIKYSPNFYVPNYKQLTENYEKPIPVLPLMTSHLFVQNEISFNDNDHIATPIPNNQC